MNQPILSYEEFVTYIRENMEDRLEDTEGLRVMETEVVKNNGVTCETLAIERGEGECSPVYYLRDLYGRYLQGTSIQALLDEITADYRQRGGAHGDLAYQWFLQLENVYERIILKAVNYNRNRRQLEDCPYIRELDLALTFRVLVDKEPHQIATILVTREMMQAWALSEFDLFDLAVHNMQQFWRPTLEPIRNVLQMLTQTGMEDELPGIFREEDLKERLPMYVLSNDLRLNGATVLFYTDCLRQFAARVKQNIYILPSSIHEVLLIPEEADMTAWDFREIVEQVNHQLVAEEDILSDHVYRYLYREDRMVIGA